MTMDKPWIPITLMVLLTCSEGVFAQSPGDNPATSDQAPTGLSDGEQQALGCAMVAGVSLAATTMAGSTEIMMLWGGGMLVPSRASTLWLALFTQIGVSGCALGAIATPTVLWAIDQSDNIAARAAQISDNVAQQIVETSAWAGAAVMSAFVGQPKSSPQATPVPITSAQ
ncbi:exported hypothetical protein [Gammaproteobacteria bacterium]